MLKRIAQGLVIILLIAIPVPVGALFAKALARKPRPVAAKVVRKEEEDQLPSP